MIAPIIIIQYFTTEIKNSVIGKKKKKKKLKIRPRLFFFSKLLFLKKIATSRKMWNLLREIKGSFMEAEADFEK